MVCCYETVAETSLCLIMCVACTVDVIVNTRNLYSKNSRSWKFIFKEKSLFEISEGKYPTRYTVTPQSLTTTITVNCSLYLFQELMALAAPIKILV